MATDLSRPDSGSLSVFSEVFRYPMIREIAETACDIVEVVGDFDLLALNSQFRVDQQGPGPAHGFAGYYWGNMGETKGIGIRNDDIFPPCAFRSRLKNHWGFPLWTKARTVVVKGDGPDSYDRALNQFAHEMGHTWLANASYLRNGERLSLAAQGGHWDKEVHVPAPFPLRGQENGSVMGGNFWRENADGTFTPTSGWTSEGGGFSWLDLYLMGLATADEVPDMFVLRNLRQLTSRRDGPHQGEKEVVTMDQILAALGPRDPPPERAQKVFHIGFVYFLLPGQEPDPELLREHAEYRERALEHWRHVTGGRGQLTTEPAGRP